MKAAALANPKIRKFVAEKTIRKVVAIPKKLVSIAAS
jgi:leucyl-tRNA synthetase